MPLYLDELWLNTTSKESLKRGFELFKGMSATGGYPEGVTLRAGPWFSNEEAKVIVVLDIADHAKTFVPFGIGLTQGWLLRRRLTPIVEPSAVDDLLSALPPAATGGRP